MKKTVITCVTAVLCVIAVCVSSVLGTNKISDAKIEAAKYAPASSSSGNGGATVDNGSGDVTPDDSSVTPETPTDPATGEPDSTAEHRRQHKRRFFVKQACFFKALYSG